MVSTSLCVRPYRPATNSASQLTSQTSIGMSRISRSSTGADVRRPVRIAEPDQGHGERHGAGQVPGPGPGVFPGRPRQVRRDHQGAHDDLAVPQGHRPVPAHHRPVPDGLGTEVGQLGVALGDGHAERTQAAHQQEPARRPHVRGGGPAEHAEQETGRHEEDFDHRDVLEHPGVEERQGQVAAHARGEQRLGDHQAAGQAGRGRDDTQHDRVPLGQVAGGHRPVPLTRVAPVTLGVGHVVDEIHRDRGAAEGGRGHEGVDQPVPPAEPDAGQRRREDQQVLRPLPRTGGAQHGQRPAGAAGMPGAGGHLGGARLGGHRA